MDPWAVALPRRRARVRHGSSLIVDANADRGVVLTGVLRELLALGDGGRAMSERTATTVYGSLGAASCAVLRRRRGSSSRSSRINLLWLCARDAEDDAPGASTSEALHRPNLLARSARRRPARRSPLERCGGVRRIAVGLPGLGAPGEGSVAAAGAWKWQGEKGPFGNVKRDPSVGTGAYQRVFFCRAWAVWFRWAALRR